MFLRQDKSYLINILLVTVSCFSGSVLAEKGHCNYLLFSKAQGRSFEVCQTARKVTQCGELLKREYDHSRAHAVRKKGRKIKLVKGNCSVEAVVGICTLPHTQIYFYEGETEALAVGCDRMKGRWEVQRF